MARDTSPDLSSRVRPSTAFRPTDCQSNRGQNPEGKTPSPIFRKIHPRQIRNARSVFSFGVAEALRGGGGAIRRAYDLSQSYHALPACAEASAGRRACLIRGSAGNESELFGIMSTYGFWFVYNLWGFGCIVYCLWYLG